MTQYNPTLGDRFWAKVDKSGDCWLWMASKSLTGYGRYRHGGKHRQAHRLALEERLGSHLGQDLHACHHCDVPSCVNPDHLFAGTREENMADRKAKCRHERCGPHKLNPVAIQVIRYFAKKGGWGWQTRVARAYGINVSTVRRIINGEMWSHVH